jgi:hypothetical protein
MRLATKAEVSVAASSPVGLVAVPTWTSPVEPDEGEALTLDDGETELEGLSEELGDRESEAELDGDTEALALELGLTLALAELEGLRLKLGVALGLELGETDADRDCEAEGELDTLLEAEALGLRLGLALTLALELGLIDEEGDSEAEELELGDTLEETETDADGEVEAEAAPGAVIILPNKRTSTAPVTVNNVATPTAPALACPVNVMRLRSWIDQSALVTGAPFLLD